MLINEIFQSISGESCQAGRLAIFIRTQGCPLRCDYCFGVKPGRKIPLLRRGYANTDYRGNHDLKITEAVVGDWIMTYDDDMNLVETRITGYNSREVLEWYEITIDGTLYYITPEHPIFTIHGIKRAKDLIEGDVIIECNTNRYLSYMSTVRNCMKNPEVVAKMIANTDYTKSSIRQHDHMISIWKQINSLIKNEVPFKDWPEECYNRYNAFKSKERRKKLSESKKGSRNPNYDADAIHRPNYEALKQDVRNGKITRSQLSGKTLEEDSARCFHVHHIDGDDTNDNWDNLIVVTSREHNQIHQRGYSFWKSERKDGKRLSKLVENNGKIVQKIKHVDITHDPYLGRHYGPKPLTVYTLKCEPYNTYLIDNMWVHNCDSMYAVDGNEYEDMTVDEILAELSKYTCKYVVFTGGEPLIQKDALDLIYKLTENGYHVEIETCGAVDIADVVYLDDVTVTMDWKCPSSKMTSKMISSNLALLTNKDVLKFVVGSQEDLDEMKRISFQTSAQVFVSPVFGMIEPKEIVEYMIKHNLNSVRLQLQLHKLCWDPSMKGV